MFDQAFIVDSITRWTGLDIKLPKQLATAIETYDAIRYAELGHRPVFDLAGVTAANAEAKIREYADQLLPTLGLVKRVGAVDVSVLGVAKQDAVNAAAREVLTQAGAAVPEIIKQLTPRLEKAAAEFATAVELLPDDLSDTALVQAGPAVLAAYQDAVATQAVLTEIDNWVASLATMAIQGLAGPVDPVMRLLRPADASQLMRLDNARGSFGRLAPHYVVAAREGVEFGLNTPQEAARLRADIEAKGRARAERERRNAIA